VRTEADATTHCPSSAAIAASAASKLRGVSSDHSGFGVPLVADEAVALALARRRITRDLRRRDERAELREGVPELALVDIPVKTADEEVGTDVELPLVRRGHVDADRLAEELDLIHDLDGVVGVLGRVELA